MRRDRRACERFLPGRSRLWLDATHVKVRQAGRIVSIAATIAVAVNTDGRREVLGMATGASEAETFLHHAMGHDLLPCGPARTNADAPIRQAADGTAW